MHTLRICTYNIHKGFSQFNRRMVIHELRERLRQLDPDIVFLQEVQGLHLRHARRHADWPQQPQHEFLAGSQWRAAYGGNAAYAHGHHGNAVLSRLPILAAHNYDVTQHRLERRGLLHCEIGQPDDASRIHCICVHLSLTEAQRRRQLQALVTHIARFVPPDAPLIIAGDFNDWRGRADDWLTDEVGLLDAYTLCHGHAARSYPSTLPMLRLDRIYLRGLRPRHAEVHWGPPWSGISDHAVLTATVELPR